MIFAISMDYTVFLLSSAKEHYDRSGDPRDASIGGLAHSGRVIFAAAAVMVAVFFTFALSGPLPPKEMGVILGVAVLLDAMLVRLVLIPTLLRVFGHCGLGAARAGSTGSSPTSSSDTPDARALADRVVPRLASRPRATDRARRRLRHAAGPGREGAAHALREATGSDMIPALVLEDGSALVGEDAIDAYLDAHVAEPPGAEAAPTEGGQGSPPLPGGGMRMLATGYTLSATTELPFAEAVERVRDELKDGTASASCARSTSRRP